MDRNFTQLEVEQTPYTKKANGKKGELSILHQVPYIDEKLIAHAGVDDNYDIWLGNLTA